MDKDFVKVTNILQGMLFAHGPAAFSATLAVALDTSLVYWTAANNPKDAAQARKFLHLLCEFQLWVMEKFPCPEDVEFKPGVDEMMAKLKEFDDEAVG